MHKIMTSLRRLVVAMSLGATCRGAAGYAAQPAVTPSGETANVAAPILPDAPTPAAVAS